MVMTIIPRSRRLTCMLEGLGCQPRPSWCCVCVEDPLEIALHDLQMEETKAPRNRCNDIVTTLDGCST